MANPQIENGYVKIANEIYEALCHIRIPGEARQILDVIIRKTYGYNKKEDAISLSQFVHATGIRRQEVVRGITKLIDINLVRKKASTLANIYGLNKDFDTWRPDAKKRRGTQKSAEGGRKKASKRTLNSVIQKTVTKDNLQKTGDINITTPSEKAKWFFEVVMKQPLPDDARAFLNALVEKTGESKETVWCEVQKFVSYWTEKTKNGKKERWETQKTFEVERRLTTWFGNINNRRTTKQQKTVIL